MYHLSVTNFHDFCHWYQIFNLGAVQAPVQTLLHAKFPEKSTLSLYITNDGSRSSLLYVILNHKNEICGARASMGKIATMLLVYAY